MDFRKEAGEQITKESWLMRDLWQLANKRDKRTEKLILQKIKNPKRLKHTGIKSLIERGLYTQKIVTPLPEGTKRREFKAAHGFRKFF